MSWVVQYTVLSPPIKAKQLSPYLEFAFGKCGPNETVLSSSVTKLGDMSQQPLCLWWQQPMCETHTHAHTPDKLTWLAVRKTSIPGLSLAEIPFCWLVNKAGTAFPVVNKKSPSIQSKRKGGGTEGDRKQGRRNEGKKNKWQWHRKAKGMMETGRGEEVVKENKGEEEKKKSRKGARWAELEKGMICGELETWSYVAWWCQRGGFVMRADGAVWHASSTRFCSAFSAVIKEMFMLWMMPRRGERSVQ